MESSPDLGGIPRFIWRFTPRLLGAASQTFFLQLYNPGSLPTEFVFKFPTDRDLEPEPWVDEGALRCRSLLCVCLRCASPCLHHTTACVLVPFSPLQALLPPSSS